MHHLRPAQQALRLAASSQHPYICRACLAHARHLSTTSPRSAGARGDISFWERMRKSVFGSKENTEAEARRAEKTKRRLGEHGTEKVTVTDSKGNVYEVAEYVDPNTHSNYMQAQTWHGLERIGSEEWVKARADQGEVYLGFMPKHPIQLTNAQWRKLIRQVAMEVFNLQKSGKDVLEVCNEEASAASKALIGQIKEADKTESEITSDQSASLRNVDVRDAAVKFAIVKRTMQLTGKRVPDPVISSAATLADLYDAFRTKEKVKKLAKTPELQRLHEQMPNVRVAATRRTPVHREKEIGRWKIIEDELVLRDLPVFGSRRQDAKKGLKNDGL